MDKKARNILLSTFWNDGWLEERNSPTTSEEYEYAKSKGLMFDPVTISHDSCLKEIAHLVRSISQEKINHAFLSSLTTRRLDWRSACASFALAKRVRPHTYSKVTSGTFYDINGNPAFHSYTCGKCRDSYTLVGDEVYKAQDLNVLNFERIKWGGIRHAQIIYIYFDLREFEKIDIAAPTPDDIACFEAILEVIATSDPDDDPGTLEKRLAPIIKSNTNERQTLIEILATLGVLQPLEYDRQNHGKNDWCFAEMWRGEDKYNEEAALSLLESTPSIYKNSFKNRVD